MRLLSSSLDVISAIPTVKRIAIFSFSLFRQRTLSVSRDLCHLQNIPQFSTVLYIGSLAFLYGNRIQVK